MLNEISSQDLAQLIYGSPLPLGPQGNNPFWESSLSLACYQSAHLQGREEPAKPTNSIEELIEELEDAMTDQHVCYVTADTIIMYRKSRGTWRVFIPVYICL